MQPTEWVERSVYDLATYQNGRAFKAGETRSSSGLPIVKIAELNRGINASTGRFEGDVEARHIITSGDVIFSWSGTIVVTRWRGPQAALNQHLFKVTVKPEFDEDYVLYVLQSLVPRFNQIVEDQRTTMGHVKVSDLRAMSVLVPPRPAQEVIGRSLRRLDEQAVLNGKIVEKAESLILLRLAQAERDAGYTWAGVALTATADFVNGGAYTKGASGTGRMVVRIRELNGGPNDTTVYSDLDVPEDREARAGDILFSWSGSLGIYRWSGPTSIVNQHIFKVVPKYPAWFVYARLMDHLPDFQAIARDKATTMGHIQRHHLDEAMVRIPSTTHLDALDAELSPLWDLIVALEKQNHAISLLSSAALPDVIGGRIDLSNSDAWDAA